MKRLIGIALAALVVAATPALALTELTFYYPIAVGGPLTKVVDNLVAGFEQEHTDVRVHASYAGNYDDARIKALAALKAGQPAQMSVLFSIDLYELLEQDAIVAFDDIGADKTWLQSFYPALMANGTCKGKVYGIPFQRSTIVMYWNKDAFKEAGLDPEKAPATWDEMAKMAAKLVKKDAGGNLARWGVMVPSTGYAYWMFQAFARENGQDLMNRDGNQTNFADADETPKLKEYVTGFPQAAVARDQLKFATPELSTFQTGRVRKALDDAIQAALTGGKAPAEALKAAQQEAERLLKPYR